MQFLGFDVIYYGDKMSVPNEVPDIGLTGGDTSLTKNNPYSFTIYVLT